MKPTPAQIEYLKEALVLFRAGTKWHKGFRVEQLGRKAIGLECLDNGWLDGTYYGYMFFTPAGRAVLTEQEPS